MTKIKLSKTQLSKIIQSGGFHNMFHGQLIKVGLPLMKKVFKSLAKNLFTPNTGIYKKIIIWQATKLAKWYKR